MKPMLIDGVTKEIILFFMGQPIFDRINVEELKVIARHMSAVNLKAGETLFKEADRGNSVYFVVEGELDVIRNSEESGGQVNLATLKTGDSIGEMSIVDDAPRSATIVARTDAQFYFLSKSAFELILEKHAKIGIKILMGLSRLLSTHLRETSRRLVDYMPPIS
jgi:CRP/FNR family cyclic AMP-dependent transcriptional regulator